jgi:hypothetical protein
MWAGEAQKVEEVQTEGLNEVGVSDIVSEGYRGGKNSKGSGSRRRDQRLTETQAWGAGMVEGMSR